MNETPTETDVGNFATQIGVLWENGAVKLPKLAREYSSMASALHQTSVHEKAAFWRTGGEMIGPRDNWIQLRDTLQRILAETSRGLDSVGRALVEAAEHYAATDAEGAAKLEEKKAVRNRPGLDKPNQDVPPAPMPRQRDPDPGHKPVHGPI